MASSEATTFISSSGSKGFSSLSEPDPVNNVERMLVQFTCCSLLLLMKMITSTTKVTMAIKALPIPIPILAFFESPCLFPKVGLTTVSSKLQSLATSACVSSTHSVRL